MRNKKIHQQEWVHLQVKDIALVKGGKRLPAGEEFSEGVTKFPYIRVTDMKNGGIDESNIVYVKPEIEPFIRNYKIKTSDIYVSIAGTLGLFGRIPEKFNNAQLTENAAKITQIDQKQADLNFLTYLLSSQEIRGQIDRDIGVGAGVPKLALYRIEGLWLILPNSIDDQKKIARILCTVDNLIEKTQSLIDKYTAVKQGMMRDLFTRGIDVATGELRPSYEQAPQLYKETELGWLPREWEIRLLDDCVRSDAPICYGILMPGLHVDNGVPVIKVKDIFDGAICADNLLLTDPKIDAAYKRSRLRQNDLLVTIRGTTGRVALVPPALDGANITQDTARIRLKDNYISSYFFYLFQSANFQAQVELHTLGQAVKGINISEVRKLRVPTPIGDEQRQICRVLDYIHSAKQVNINYRNKLVHQKNGLMQDLLTGSVRVD